MQFLENDSIKIFINPKGAELTSIFDKTNNTEYMWDGNPSFWGKHSPVLFPIVGTLKEDTYFYEGIGYKLGRHGFARDMVFDLKERTTNSIAFSIQSGKETFEKFPFEFELQLIYTLEGKSLFVTYHVVNTGKDELYFSIGGHPAFKLPVAAGTSYDDYYLEFEKDENAGRWPISKDGLIELEPVPLLEGKKLMLSKALFQKDALVFKHLQSSFVKLKSGKTDKGFQFNFEGFPYLGIWAAKDADFICIEPWCGIADPVDSQQDFTQKEGIHILAPKQVFERTWSIALF